MKKNESGITSFLKSHLFAIALFVVIAVMMVIGFQETAAKRREQAIQSANDSILRAVVTCYAIEGCYPDCYEYIKENYNVYINENKLSVQYSVLGSNIMPNFRIIEKG